MDVVGYALLASCAAGLGAMGGLGGAILLVPALVVSGMPAAEAAPLGLISVAAGSIAAGARQLRERSTNHRLGVATEVVGSLGAVVGATLSGLVGDRVLTFVLAAVAATAAIASFRPATAVTPPATEADVEVGERVGSLAGVCRVDGERVAYVPRRLALGLSLMGVAGLIAGTAGASGGFIKTPATSELMAVPARVAASTTTFTVGVTSSAALIVFAIDGRIDARTSCAVIAGSLVGGRVGAALQSRLADDRLRRVLGALLVVVAVVLVVRA
ncbi:sulfite exporter TauE/SafE family protein [Ilumatobacter sp.]|uniref:sulfite exporter TauE/SafE family protein n=1 Tax=Ilumatobacter sp. TaxID=1967498 RepID=UPI003B519410